MGTTASNNVRPLRLLIVEDNPADADLIAELLHEEQPGRYEITICAELKEARRLLAAEEFGAVVSDLTLPDSTGVETFRRLRAAAPHLPLVLLTGMESESLAIQTVKEGAQDYLAKNSLDGKLLIRSLAYAIERKENEEQLRQQAEKLEQLNRELDAFAHTVAHDLKAPLTAVLALADELKLEVNDCPHRGECAHLVERIIVRSHGMNDLIGNLLAFARIKETKLLSSEVDLSALAAATLADLHETEPARRVEIRVAPGLHARVDQGLMQIVLNNLLGNAWKYTGQTEMPRIEFGRGETSRGPAFFVRDNGPGFPAVEAGRIFEPFYRLAEATEFKGTGLGLATVKRIIERHGGRVWAESEPGRGATFHFQLGA